jgi:hypothetical protein
MRLIRDKLLLIIILVIMNSQSSVAQSISETINYTLIGLPGLIQTGIATVTDFTTMVFEIKKTVKDAQPPIPLTDDEMTNLNYVNIGGGQLFYAVLRDPLGSGKLLMREIVKIADDLYAQQGEVPELEASVSLQQSVLYSHTMIDGKVYTMSFSVELRESPTGNSRYMIIDNVHVEPASIEMHNFENTFLTDITIMLSGTRIPRIQRQYWDDISSSNYRRIIKFDKSLITPGPITAVLDVSAVGILGTKSRGEFVFSTTPISFPPNPPVLMAISKQNSIQISVSNPQSGVDHYELYRNLTSTESIQSPPFKIFSGNVYEDMDIENGKRFYYKVLAVNATNLKSNASNEVNGLPLRQYNVTANLSNTAVGVNAILDISGQVQTLEGQPVTNASVSISVPEMEWIVGNVFTNSSGYYSKQFNAPSIAGNYDLRISVGNENDGAVVLKQFNVSERPERYHNLAITSLDLNNKIQSRGQSLQATATISNQGISNETGALLDHRLLDESGAEVFSASQSLSLNKGINQAFVQAYIIPYTLPLGNYVWRSDISTNNKYDELKGNNRTSATIYIDTNYTTPIYRTHPYQLDSLGDSIVVDRITVRLTSKTSTSVTLLVGTESTGPLYPVLDESHYWLNSGKTFVVVPTSLFTTDTTVQVKFYAGISNTQTTVTPFKQFVKKGNSGTYCVTCPGGTTISNTGYSFPFGNDKNKFNSWSSSFISVPGQNNSANLSFTIPSTENTQDYSTFFAWSDNTSRYYKELRLRCVPVHDLQIVGTIQVTNGETNFMPGDVVNISGVVKNAGGYAEKPFVQLSITRYDTLVYSDFVELSLSSGSSQSFSFVWSTLGLPVAPYSVTVSAPQGEDETSGNNQQSQSVILIAPFSLTVNITDFPKVYEISDSIKIRCSVTDGINNNVVSTASILATVKNPDNTIREIQLTWRSATNCYEGYIYSYLGGNYNISATAEHKRYLQGHAQKQAHTYVDVQLSLPFSSMLLTQGGAIDLICSSVGDIAGFAADLVYDHNRAKLVKIVESSFLNEMKNIPTSVNYSDGNDRTVVGITRLQSHQWGAISFTNQVVGSAFCIGREAGNVQFQLQNVGLIASDGTPMAVRVGASKVLAVTTQNSALVLESDKTTTVLNRTDTTNLYAVGAYGLQSVAGEITFDPTSLEIVNMIEDSTLNEKGKVQTVFAKSIDNISGHLTFGISRTGSFDHGISTNVDRIARITYRSRKNGQVFLSLSNTGMFSSYENMNLPHFSMDQTITVQELPASDSAHVAISPAKSNVNIDSVFTVAVTVANVQNLFALATNISYNPTQLRYVTATEGAFMNSDGSANTSFNCVCDTSSGILFVGLTRLGSTIGGVSTDISRTIFTLKFRRLTINATSIDFGNFGLLKPDGVTRIPTSTQPGEVTFPNIQLPLKIFLEGAFNAGLLTTTLNSSALLPLTSETAYAAASYVYTPRTVTSIPNTNIVDWILVELRSGTAAITKIATQVGFIKKDGSIVDIDGTSPLSFSVAAGNYYIVIRHRNHLAVMSVAPVTLSGTTALYDFTTGQDRAYGTNPMVLLSTGAYGMYAGDANKSGFITAADINDVISNLNLNAYLSSDANLTGYTTASDINIMIANLNKNSQVPN